MKYFFILISNATSIQPKMFSKNSREPTLYETLPADGMKLRSGRIVNTVNSSCFAQDIRVMTSLFAHCPILRYVDGISWQRFRGATIVNSNKVTVEQFLRRKFMVKFTYLSFAGRGWIPRKDSTYIPRYLLRILKKDYCPSCLKGEIICAFASRYKDVYRNLTSDSFKNLKRILFEKLDDIIRDLEKKNRASPGYGCLQCDEIHARMREIAYDGRVTRRMSLSGIDSEEQRILNSLVKRNTLSTLEKVKQLEKYISTPHREVQKTYFKLGSILPGECVKNIFAFI